MLEVECAAEGAPALSVDQVRELLAVLPEIRPSALYAPDRLGVQFSVSAPSIEAAARRGIELWRDAVVRTGLRGWVLARVEVKTPAEHAADEATRLAREVAVSSVPADPVVVREAYLATRSIVRATSVERVVGLLSAVVHRLGGRVVPALEEHPDALPIDLSFGATSRMYPATGGDAAVEARIRHVLPALIEDAQIVLEQRGLWPPIPPGPAG